jgi:hypothetical protein
MVQITHIPTGIVARCDCKRSQYENQLAAMKLLRSRLYMHNKLQIKEEEMVLVEYDLPDDEPCPNELGVYKTLLLEGK